MSRLLQIGRNTVDRELSDGNRQMGAAVGHRLPQARRASGRGIAVGPITSAAYPMGISVQTGPDRIARELVSALPSTIVDVLVGITWSPRLRRRFSPVTILHAPITQRQPVSRAISAYGVYADKCGVYQHKTGQDKVTNAQRSNSDDCRPKFAISVGPKCLGRRPEAARRLEHVGRSALGACASCATELQR
ncbi:hypothetical protein K505DRAFT_391995 [Melanomma pulvis-pyrius CBS 109.77]|uniref:Uncharacterized protein n=1 Tax=Melanomma pulvis-pyrius CBS 109.77 TaxID=1314802 RepID=A0A6A6X0A1_9PLEO|nr:hypothetical protein K505DRAFT_391995 [Melanomma pulvis-pyrius CBS 109.77]